MVGTLGTLVGWLVLSVGGTVLGWLDGTFGTGALLVWVGSTGAGTPLVGGTVLGCTGSHLSQTAFLQLHLLQSR